jgi:hypothetical protein
MRSNTNKREMDTRHYPLQQRLSALWFLQSIFLLLVFERIVTGVHLPFVSLCMTREESAKKCMCATPPAPTPAVSPASERSFLTTAAVVHIKRA